MTMTIRPLLLTRYCSTNQSAKSQLTHHTLFGEFKSCSTISFSSSYCCGGAMTVCNLPIVYQKTPHHNKSTTENSIQLLSTSSFFNPTTPAANTATNTTDIYNTAVIRYDNNCVTIPFVGCEKEAVSLKQKMTNQTHKHHVFLMKTKRRQVFIGPYKNLEKAKDALNEKEED